MKISVQHVVLPSIASSAGAVFTVNKLTASDTAAQAAFQVKKDLEKSDITITFDPDGGSADYYEKTCTIGDYIGDLPSAQRDYDYFEGWVNSYGSTVDYYTYAYQESASLTAQYTPPTTITFDANGGTLVGQDSMRVYYGHPMYESPDYMPTAQSSQEGMSFAGWYTDPMDGQLVDNNTYFYGEFETLYAHYSSKSYSVDLNSQWYLMTGSSTDPNGKSSPYQTNPDSSTYDGVYASYSNYNVGNGWARMRITFSGYDTFVFYLRSYAESNFDYCVAGKIDVAITSLPSQSTGSYSTYGKQNSGQTIGSYTACSYSNDGGSHFVDVVFRKDGSVNSGNDRGYVLIPKS